MDKLVAAQTDFATARLALLAALLAVDYESEPEDEGSLDDLTTEERLNLVIRTNVSLRQGYRTWIDGQEKSILDHWPAQEFYQTYEADEPVDWPSSWQAAGGRIFSGCMIALKNGPLWQSLSSFGMPYPPFAPGSSFDVRDVKRGVAVQLGLLGKNDCILPLSLPPPNTLLLF